MNTFEKDVYTSQALAMELTDIYAACPDTLLVGSLGRAGIIAEYTGDPNYEFTARGEDPLFGTKPRDIDIIGDDLSHLNPFIVDAEVFNHAGSRIVKDGMDWLLLRDGSNFCEPISPDVMEPQEVKTIFDIPCKTVSPQTHRALHGLNGVIRQKDSLTMAIFDQAIGVNDTLPAELYEPFETLRRYNEDLMVTKMRQWYRRRIPLSVRSVAIPIIRPFKNIADKHVRVSWAKK
jgi:hypothetical protein